MLKLDIKKQFNNWTLRVKITNEKKRLVIWGPSGSGKSLTLKMIAGLMEPDEGEISIKGNILYSSKKGINLSPQQRKIGFVFQNYALFPHLSVFENLAFGLKAFFNKNGHKEQLKDKIYYIAKRLEIDQLLDSYPKQLSGGQQQRVALGRVLLIEPDLVLLDEPFNSLDVALRYKLRELFVSISEDFNLPLILVTHDPEDVKEIGEEMAIIQKGLCICARPIPVELIKSNRQQLQDPIWDYIKKQEIFLDKESSKRYISYAHPVETEINKENPKRCSTKHYIKSFMSFQLKKIFLTKKL